MTRSNPGGLAIPPSVPLDGVTPPGLLVGTSGFVYRHWEGAFYPEDLPARRRLAFYAEHFRTVELNVTFYRMPAPSAFAGWREQVPPGFRFAVKASRYLTHILRLRRPREPVELLLERITLLGDRLGPVLLQLPPDMGADLDALEATLEVFGRGVEVAVEPRHRSWFTPALRMLLERRGAALCLADRRGPITPAWQTAPWLYLRFHGGRASPPSCYGRAALAGWAGRVGELAGGAPLGYAYFNNDAHACAVRNAREFERSLGLPAAPRWLSHR